MTTQLIGVKEFRANMASLHKKAWKKNVQYIVLSRSRPVFKVTPLTPKEKFYASIQKGEEQYRRGDVYTLEEVAKKLGL